MADWHVTAVTREALRAAGQWPTGETLVEQLAVRISEAAEGETDPDRKGGFRRLPAGSGERPRR
jgi:hypothetical protein